MRTNVFLAPNLGKVAVESEKLLYATNILFEYKADDLVLEKGLSSPYSDAIFKAFALEFAFENASYLDYYLFLHCRKSDIARRRGCPGCPKVALLSLGQGLECHSWRVFRLYIPLLSVARLPLSSRQ